MHGDAVVVVLEGAGCAYYLVHSMGRGEKGFRELERRAARSFLAAADAMRVRRIVYLGGVAPRGSGGRCLDAPSCSRSTTRTRTSRPMPGPCSSTTGWERSCSPFAEMSSD